MMTKWTTNDEALGFIFFLVKQAFFNFFTTQLRYAFTGIFSMHYAFLAWDSSSGSFDMEPFIMLFWHETLYHALLLCTFNFLPLYVAFYYFLWFIYHIQIS